MTKTTTKSTTQAQLSLHTEWACNIVDHATLYQVVTPGWILVTSKNFLLSFSSASGSTKKASKLYIHKVKTQRWACSLTMMLLEEKRKKRFEEEAAMTCIFFRRKTELHRRHLVSEFPFYQKSTTTTTPFPFQLRWWWWDECIFGPLFFSLWWRFFCNQYLYKYINDT